MKSENEVLNVEKLEDFNQWLPSGFLWLNLMMKYNQFPPISFVFELKLCKELGGFDSSLPVLGDWDFHLRLMLKRDIWVLPETLAFYHHRLNSTGSLGNSVIAGVSKHHLYRACLENKWLREDIDAGKNGLGTLLTLLSAIHNK